MHLASILKKLLRFVLGPYEHSYGLRPVMARSVFFRRDLLKPMRISQSPTAQSPCGTSRSLLSCVWFRTSSAATKRASWWHPVLPSCVLEVPGYQIDPHLTVHLLIGGLGYTLP